MIRAWTVSALAEMYVHGGSTRKVKAITEAFCGHTFSASTISRIKYGPGLGSAPHDRINPAVLWG